MTQQKQLFQKRKKVIVRNEPNSSAIKQALEVAATIIIDSVINPLFDEMHRIYPSAKVLHISFKVANSETFEVTSTHPLSNFIGRIYNNPSTLLYRCSVWNTVIKLAREHGIEGMDNDVWFGGTTYTFFKVFD